MQKDQRLIPFLGGLVIGGAAGSQCNKMPNYNNVYPVYYYPTPYYNNAYYPYYNYQQMPINSQYYNINPYQSTGNLSNENRSLNDISFVPIYYKKID